MSDKCLFFIINSITPKIIKGNPNSSATEKSAKSTLINDRIISGIVTMYIPIFSILLIVNTFLPNITYIHK